jgi:hypothetical protein
MCDHTPGQREQTQAEMMRPLNDAETKVWQTEPDDSPKKIAIAKKNAHLPTE